MPLAAEGQELCTWTVPRSSALHTPALQAGPGDESSRMAQHLRRLRHQMQERMEWLYVALEQQQEVLAKQDKRTNDNIGKVAGYQMEGLEKLGDMLKSLSSMQGDHAGFKEELSKLHKERLNMQAGVFSSAAKLAGIQRTEKAELEALQKLQDHMQSIFKELMAAVTAGAPGTARPHGPLPHSVSTPAMLMQQQAYLPGSQLDDDPPNMPGVGSGGLGGSGARPGSSGMPGALRVQGGLRGQGSGSLRRQGSGAHGSQGALLLPGYVADSVAAPAAGGGHPYS